MSFKLNDVTAAFARYQQTAFARDPRAKRNGASSELNQLATPEVTMPDTARDNPSTTTPPTQPAPAPPPEPTPADKLKAAKAKLDQNETQLKDLTKTLDNNKSDVDSLTKIVAEIDGVAGSYEKARKGIDGDLKDLNAYNDAKLVMVTGLLGDKKNDIDAKIAAVDTAIKDANTALATAQQAQPALDKAANDAQQKLDAAQQAYDDYKNLPATIGDVVAKTKDLKTKIEKAEDESKPAVMYVYLLEQDKVLTKIDKVPSEEEFTNTLNDLRNKLDAAQADAKAKKQAADAGKEDVAKKQKAVADLNTSRVADILKKVEA